MKYALPSENMRQEILQRSYMRSRTYGISPDQKCAPESSRLKPRDLDHLRQANKVLLELVLRQMGVLHQILVDSSYAMAIADKEGYILEVTGHRAMLDEYRIRKCLPGYRWTERDVGTCSIGLVLTEKRPIMLLEGEMFNQHAAHVTNSAAPIFDHRDIFLGVLNISGPASATHLHTLGLVIQATATIRAQLAEIENQQNMALKDQYLMVLLESDRRGIIALDKNGCIVHHNTKARKMLCLPEDAIGAPLDAVVASSFKIQPFSAQKRGFSEREISYRVQGQMRSFVATLDPVTLPNGRFAGSLLLLVEKQQVINLVNSLSGVQAKFSFKSIISRSKELEKTLQYCRQAAKSPSPVLLFGETGTGKELFAQAIHNASDRRGKPFISINCGAIPRELLESELFGYEEGAFTGASRKGHPGKLELAHHGTLFLDEVGDMPLDMQVKLLRVLQSGEVHRLGSRAPLHLDFRVIAATNVDLKLSMRNKEFREDLFYRISTFFIKIPPLREREGDIELLANFFLKRFSGTLGRADMSFSPEALELLLRYSWPGNVRQLESIVERTVNLCQRNVIEPGDLDMPQELPASAMREVEEEDAHSTLDDVCYRYIARLMRAEHDNIRRVAAILDISRQTLYRKLEVMALRGIYQLPGARLSHD